MIIELNESLIFKLHSGFGERNLGDNTFSDFKKINRLKKFI